MMEATVHEKVSTQELRTEFRGELLHPGDDGYDNARRIYNGIIDKRPLVIARCAGAADVISAVNFARTHDLTVAVKGGGHSVAGKSVCDGGLMIDLSLMKGIRVDPTSLRARAQPGLRLGDFDRETQGFGLATPLGIVSNTGIAGLTLGGGIGWLNGKYGLACDNLISADVVTAEGKVLTASPTENQDLFWGLRGGGGNFGIVTSFEYKLHPVGPVLGGMVVYPMSKARDVLQFYYKFSKGCPDELSTVAGLLTGPDGNPVVVVAVCYAGSVEEGEKVIEPLRSLDSPVADLIRPMRYVELQSFFDAGFPPGRLHYWKSNFVRTLNEDAIEVMVESAERRPSPLSALVLQQIHGATSRVSPSNTAFPHRQNQYDLLIVAQWADPKETSENVKWARETWEKTQPYVERSVYVNDLGEEGEERVNAAYGPNYQRLTTLKNRYDPTNFFHENQNIKPAMK